MNKRLTIGVIVAVSPIIVYFLSLTVVVAVQQSKIGRKRKVNRALNQKRRNIFGVKANCETASALYKNEENATDYSKSEHWLSLPASVDKEVDVFYIYPTVWQKVDKDDPNICNIDNPSMLNGHNRKSQ